MGFPFLVPSFLKCIRGGDRTYIPIRQRIEHHRLAVLLTLSLISDTVGGPMDT